jgi:Flp pilus assembly protein TadB
MIAAAAVAGGLVVAGILVVIAGTRPAPQRPATARRPRTGLLSRVPRRTWQLAGIGLTVGMVVWILTGWMLALVVVPVAAAGLPYLLSSAEPARRIERLDAMEEWTRSLAGVLITGRGLEGALSTTLRSVPAPIAPEVRALVDRLRSRGSTQDAIWAFADDLDDATGDLVAANLLLASQRGGDGLARILTRLSEAVAQDVRARRQIEADRAKDRTNARLATLFTLAALGVLPFTGPYVEPYTTPAGQAILAVLLVAYVLLLLWLRQMAIGKPPARILPESRPGRRSA